MTRQPDPPLGLTMTYTDLLQLQADLIWIYEAEVGSKHLNLSSHFPGQAALLFTEGSAVFSDKRHKIKVQKGDWVFLRDGDRKQVIKPGSKVLSLRFMLGWPGGMPLFHWDPAITVKAAAHPGLEVRARRLFNVVQEETSGVGMGLRVKRISPVSYCLIKSAFQAFMAECIQAQIAAGLVPSLMRQLDIRVRQMLSLLSEHGFQKPFRQTELAASMGLSVSQLDRLFKKDLGMTAHEYQEHRRLEHAFVRLRHSGDSIKEVAFDLGFASPSHFSAWLRRKTNHSPSELRGGEGYAFYPHESPPIPQSVEMREM